MAAAVASATAAKSGEAGPQTEYNITNEMKEPLNYIKERSSATSLIMSQIAPEWTAPGFITPAAYATLVTELNTQSNLVTERDAQLALAAGEWDDALAQWHASSVCVSQVARGAFRGTDKLGAWRNVRATRGSREKITQAGQAIESAWVATDPTWVPKAGLTLVAYQAQRTAALNKQAAHGAAERNANLERATLSVKADGLYDLSVQWYLMATGAFPAGTVTGDLIRTIPTQYNPNVVPGRLHFEQHFSPGAGQVELVWGAARAETFDIYAKSPASADFERILEGVTQTSWVGSGLAPGGWAFKGVALNASGTGEESPVTIVPVAALAAA